MCEFPFECLGCALFPEHLMAGRFSFGFWFAPSTARPLARDLRVLIGWPFPLGFGLDGRLLLARRGQVYVQFTIIIIFGFGAGGRLPIWHGVGGFVFNSSSSWWRWHSSWTTRRSPRRPPIMAKPDDHNHGLMRGPRRHRSRERTRTGGVFRHQTNPHRGATPPKKNETPRNQKRASHLANGGACAFKTWSS